MKQKVIFSIIFLLLCATITIPSLYLFTDDIPHSNEGNRIMLAMFIVGVFVLFMFTKYILLADVQKPIDRWKTLNKKNPNHIDLRKFF